MKHEEIEEMRAWLMSKATDQAQAVDLEDEIREAGILAAHRACESLARITEGLPPHHSHVLSGFDFEGIEREIRRRLDAVQAEMVAKVSAMTDEQVIQLAKRLRKP